MNKLEDDLIELNHPVAILDEHLLEVPPDPKTGNQKPPIYLTEKHLQLIADNNNRRIKTTGDMVPVVVGHTMDGAPEKHQPELVAFAHDFHVAPFFDTGKKGLFCRWKVFKKKLQKLKEYPRRSVELWLGKWEVDPISILGATTPDRDLGLIRLARSDDQSVTRVIEDDMDPNQIVETVLAAIKELPEMKFLSDLMSQAEAMEDQPGSEAMGSPDEAMAGGPPPAEPSPEENVEKQDVQTPEGDEEDLEEEPVQKSAASASGSNTFVPGGMGRRKMSRVESLEARLAETEAANQNLAIKFARSSRRADLMRLQAEHNVDLDLEEELAFVAPEDGTPMPDSLYQAHLSRIVKKYQRAPVNQSPIITRSGPSMSSKARCDAAVELATAKGIPFAEALKQVSE